MAVQTSAWLETGIRCAIALAIGCAPRVATLPVNEPARTVEAAHDSAVLDAAEEVTVEYWVQKDDPSRPCTDANVGTNRCVLVKSDAVTSREPRFWCCDEPRDVAPEASSCDAPEGTRGHVCS